MLWVYRTLSRQPELVCDESSGRKFSLRLPLKDKQDLTNQVGKGRQGKQVTRKQEHGHLLEILDNAGPGEDLNTVESRQEW